MTGQTILVGKGLHKHFRLGDQLVHALNGVELEVLFEDQDRDVIGHQFINQGNHFTGAAPEAAQLGDEKRIFWTEFFE
jgi:hypothetical protein